MHLINHVSIEGFWGNKTVDISFGPEINFLIGVNGSGKTTIINLIAATLNVDYRTLNRFQFHRIRIDLINLENKRIKPWIEAEKISENVRSFSNLIFRLKIKPNQKPQEYPLDDIEDPYLYTLGDFRPSGVSRSIRELSIILKEEINISWLSIHRVAGQPRSNEERSFESSVDQKIDELLNSFVKYFSQLNRLAAIETDRFQQYIFLSLLADESGEQIYSILRKIDSEDEKESLKQIFDLFKLDQKVYSKKLKKHFNSFNSAVKKKSITLDDASYLIGTRRIHSVVQEWELLVQTQKKIYK